MAIVEGDAMRKTFHEHLEELRATVIRLGRARPPS